MARSGPNLRAIPPMQSAPPNITQRDVIPGCAVVDTAAGSTQTVMPMIVKPAPAIFLPARVAANWFTVTYTPNGPKSPLMRIVGDPNPAASCAADNHPRARYGRGIRFGSFRTAVRHGYSRLRRERDRR